MSFVKSFEDWVTSSSDEELKHFFSCFTTKEDKEEYSDILFMVNHFVMKKYPDEWVYKYFEFRGFIAVESNSEELDGIINKVIEDNKQVSDDLKAGKLAALGRLIGMVRKVLPSSNPQEIKKLLEQKFMIQ